MCTRALYNPFVLRYSSNDIIKWILWPITKRHTYAIVGSDFGLSVILSSFVSESSACHSATTDLSYCYHCLSTCLIGLSTSKVSYHYLSTCLIGLSTLKVSSQTDDDLHVVHVQCMSLGYSLCWPYMGYTWTYASPEQVMSPRIRPYMA